MQSCLLGVETWVFPKGTAYSFYYHISYGPIADACINVLNLHQSGQSERFMDVYASSILSTIASAPEQLSSAVTFLWPNRYQDLCGPIEAAVSPKNTGFKEMSMCTKLCGMTPWLAYSQGQMSMLTYKAVLICVYLLSNRSTDVSGCKYVTSYGNFSLR